MMEKKVHRRDDMILHTISVFISLYLISMLILLLIVHCGFKVATEAGDEDINSSWSFHVGVVTMLFGLVFVALGIPILVNLFLSLSEQIQNKDRTQIHQGGERKTIRAAICQIFTTTITMVMLVWETYMGFRIATEPTSDQRHLPLALPFGIVTIVFGSVYFVIGLAILADLALYLLGKLQENVKTRIIFYKASTTDVKSFV